MMTSALLFGGALLMEPGLIDEIADLAKNPENVTENPPDMAVLLSSDADEGGGSADPLELIDLLEYARQADGVNAPADEGANLLGAFDDLGDTVIPLPSDQPIAPIGSHDTTLVSHDDWLDL
ncbi:MAG: hypothetical protein CSA72_06615 [Rhodobacterales bacterium]|nr:MAG: hypothetical protein CSA72_06615 [Rhodobacterales bacterium]